MKTDSGALSLIKTSDSVTMTHNVTAEWNHNIFTQVKNYGTTTADPTASLFQTATLFTSNVTSSSTSFRNKTKYSWDYNFSVALGNNKKLLSFPVSSPKTYRISFYAKIDQFRNSSDVTFSFKGYNSSYTGWVDSYNVQINSIDYKKYEFVIWAKGDSDSQVDLYLNSVDSHTINISDLSICAINKAEYDTSSLFPLSSVFEGLRPGDEVAEQNLSKSVLRQQYYYTPDSSNGGVVSSKTISIRPDETGKIYAKALNTPEYYLDNKTSTSYTPAIFSIYDSPITTNKIVLKTLSGNFSRNFISGYDIYVLTNTTGTWSKIAGTSNNPAIRDNGTLILYYNGSTWSTTDASSTLSSDYTSLTNVQTIYGVYFRVKELSYRIGTTAGSVSTYTQSQIEANDATYFSHYEQGYAQKIQGFDNTIRFIELSPRLKVDLSEYVNSFSMKRSLSSSQDGILPVGVSTSDFGSITLSDIPQSVTKTIDGSTYTEIIKPFSDIGAGNIDSALSGKMGRDIKFVISCDLYDKPGGTKQNSSSILLGKVYSEALTIAEDGTVQVSLFDYAKYLQKIKSQDLLILSYGKRYSANNSLVEIIKRILDSVGFSDYNISNSDIGSNKSSYIVKNYFAESSQTVWESLQELCFAYQIILYIDEYGILRIKSLDTNIPTSPNFVFTDNAYSGYSPNIESLEMVDTPNPSSIQVKYSPIYARVSTDIDNESTGSLTVFRKRAYSEQPAWVASDGDALSYSMLRRSLTSSDSYLYLSNSTLGFDKKWVSYSGYAVIGSEIIKYDGVLYYFIISSDVESIVRDATASTVTIKMTNAHTFDIGDSVTLAGFVSPYTALNGAKVVTAITSDSITISASGLSSVPTTETYVLGATGYTKKSTIIKSLDEFERKQNELISQVNSTVPFKFGLQNSQILCNVERGKFGTQSSDHIAMVSADDLPSSARMSTVSTSFASHAALSNFSKYISIVNDRDDNIPYANIYNQNSSSNTILYFNGVDNTAYYQYNFLFKVYTDNNMTNDSLGVTLGYGASGNSGTFIKFISEVSSDTLKTEIWQDGVKRYVSDNKLKVISETKTIYKKDSNGKIIVDLKTGKPVVSELIPTKFEKMQNVTVTQTSNTTVTVSVNGKRFAWYKPGTSPSSAEYDVDLTINSNGTGIGVFVGPDSGMQLNSISAYHRNSFVMTRGTKQLNLTPIMYGGKYSEYPQFMFQVRPDVYEMKFYDVKYQSGPIFDPSVFGPEGAYSVLGSDGKALNQFNVKENESYFVSPLYSTPFRAKFFALNKSEYIIPMSSSDGTYGRLTIAGNILLNSKEGFVTIDAERKNSSDQIQLSSRWIQDEITATNIATNIVNLMPLTSRRYSLKLFGNPMLEIGDYVQLNYSLANILPGSKMYIVNGISNDYDGTLSTSVELKAVKN